MMSDSRRAVALSVADRPPRASREFAAALGDDPGRACWSLIVHRQRDASPYFLDVYNLSDATFNFSEKAIIALGMALLIIARDIDLSVASIIALVLAAMGGAARGRRHRRVDRRRHRRRRRLRRLQRLRRHRLRLCPSIVVTIGTHVPVSRHRPGGARRSGDHHYPAGFPVDRPGLCRSWPPCDVRPLFLALGAGLRLRAAPHPFRPAHLSPSAPIRSPRCSPASASTASASACSC